MYDFILQIGNLKKEHKALKEKNNNLEKEVTELKLTIKRLSTYEAQCTELEKIIGDLRQTIKVQQVIFTNIFIFYIIFLVNLINITNSNSFRHKTNFF